MHRTTFLIIALVVGVGFGVWYFSRVVVTTSSPANTNTTTNTVATVTTTALTDYRDTATGLSIRYPSDWKSSEDASGEGDNAIRNVTFTGTNDAVTITVVNTSFEGIIRESVSIQKETDITLNGMPATRLDAGSARDGSPKTVVLVKRDKTLISLNGHGEAFEQLLTTFRWPEANTPVVPE